jgi:hypothetical protein
MLSSMNKSTSTTRTIKKIRIECDDLSLSGLNLETACLLEEADFAIIDQFVNNIETVYHSPPHSPPTPPPTPPSPPPLSSSNSDSNLKSDVISFPLDVAYMNMIQSFIPFEKRNQNYPPVLYARVSSVYIEEGKLIVPLPNKYRSACKWCGTMVENGCFFFLPYCSEHRYCQKCAVYMCYSRKEDVARCGLYNQIKCYDRTKLFKTWPAAPVCEKRYRIDKLYV